MTVHANPPKKDEQPSPAQIAASVPTGYSPDEPGGVAPSSYTKGKVTRMRDLKAADAVELVLAHPLNQEKAAALGLEVPDGEELPVNDTVILHRNYARTLISSGYAQLDPEDSQAVARALTVAPAKAKRGDTPSPD